MIVLYLFSAAFAIISGFASMTAQLVVVPLFFLERFVIENVSRYGLPFCYR